MEIERPDGDRLAMVKQALLTPLRARFDVKVENGPDLEVQGNVVDHEYEIEADGTKIAEISKRWFRVRETYGIEIAPGAGRDLGPGRGGCSRRDGRPGRLGPRLVRGSCRCVRFLTRGTSIAEA